MITFLPALDGVKTQLGYQGMLEPQKRALTQQPVGGKRRSRFDGAAGSFKISEPFLKNEVR